jgi:hypothetical protein
VFLVHGGIVESMQTILRTPGGAALACMCLIGHNVTHNTCTQVLQDEDTRHSKQSPERSSVCYLSFVLPTSCFELILVLNDCSCLCVLDSQKSHKTRENGQESTVTGERQNNARCGEVVDQDREAKAYVRTVLCCAVLCCAVLCCAVLYCAVL